jgi:hypothetical protein
MRAFLALLALAMILLSADARADEIDGDWCTQDGRQHMTIRGSTIVTPEGKQTQGDYNRHSFSYQPPAPSPDADKRVFMRLLNQETMRSRVGQEPNGCDSERVWRRCSRPVS